MGRRKRFLSLVGLGLVLGGCATSQQALTARMPGVVGCASVQISELERGATWARWKATGCGTEWFCSADDKGQNLQCTPRDARVISRGAP